MHTTSLQISHYSIGILFYFAGMKENMIFCKLHYDLDSPHPQEPPLPPGEGGHSPSDFFPQPPPTGQPPLPGPGVPGGVGHPGPAFPEGVRMGGGFPGDGSIFPGDQKPPPNTQLPFYNGVGAAQKGRPRKRKSPLPVECHDPTMHGLSEFDYGLWLGWGCMDNLEAYMINSFLYTYFCTLEQ